MMQRVPIKKRIEFCVELRIITKERLSITIDIA